MAKVIEFAAKGKNRGEARERMEEIVDLALEKHHPWKRAAIKKEVMEIYDAFDKGDKNAPFEHADQFTPEQLKLIYEYRRKAVEAFGANINWIPSQLILLKILD